MNIYVGNLPFSISEKDLLDTFSNFGSVESAKIITDRDTGRSRGFGFVEMPDDDEARTAIREVPNQELEGRSLKVNEAKPRSDNRRY